MTSLLNLKAGWMILNNLIGELEKNGVKLSDLAYTDLRNSKMVLEYLSSFKDEIRPGPEGYAQLKLEIEQKILVLKDSLLIKAGERIGLNFRDTWESKFNQSLEGELLLLDEDSRTPISEIPRDMGTAYFRIKLPDNIPVEVISELAEEYQVNVFLNGDKHLQVSGKKDCIRQAMKKLGELFYGESRLK